MPSLQDRQVYIKLVYCKLYVFRLSHICTYQIRKRQRGIKLGAKDQPESSPLAISNMTKIVV